MFVATQVSNDWTGILFCRDIVDLIPVRNIDF